MVNRCGLGESSIGLLDIHQFFKLIFNVKKIIGKGMEVILIIVATLVAGVGSVLIAGLLSVNFLSRFGDYFLSFAAGAPLSTAFLNLLPESFHLLNHHSALMFTLLLGIIFFFC